MPRTSYDQFEMLITFMEEHGDLSKPAKTPKGKLTSLNKWEELAHLLNSSSSGETRTAEKWKKVWSDFKNNAKKKAGRLHKAAGGTGGGPALLSKLSDLESRALAIIGVEAATGLPVPEAGFSQQIEIPMEAEVSQVQESRDPAPPESESVLVDYDIELWNQPGPSNRPHIAPPPEPPIATSPPFLNVTQEICIVLPRLHQPDIICHHHSIDYNFRLREKVIRLQQGHLEELRLGVEHEANAGDNCSQRKQAWLLNISFVQMQSGDS